MTKLKSKNPSPFVAAAVALDQEFQQLEVLSQKLERLSLEAEGATERAVLLINDAEQCRERMVAGMQVLAKELEDSRDRAEKAIASISQCANTINDRQRETERLVGRFQALGEMVKQVNSAVAQLNPTDSDFSGDRKEILEKLLPEFNEKMGILVSEAQKLMEEAHKANLKNIERNADSLRQALSAARGRLNQLSPEERQGIH